MSRKHHTERTRTGHEQSEKYIDHAKSIEGHEWESPHPYIVGVRVVWRGVTLTCTLPHYAGDQAEHPWDPGDGWKVPKNASMWTPDGDVEAARLRVVVAEMLNEPAAGGDAFALKHRDRLKRIVEELTRRPLD